MDVKCSNLYVNGEARLVTLDYLMDMAIMVKESSENNPTSPQRKLKVDPDNR